MYEFKFPDVGEGITEGELLSWKVKEGDAVVEDQTLAEVETDKAVVEIPSPKNGRIAKLHVDEGEIIEVGQVLVTIDETAAAPAGAPAGAPAAPLSAAPATGDAQKPASAEEEVPPVPPAPVVQSVKEQPVPYTPAAAPAGAEEEPEEFYTGSVVGQLEEAVDEEEAPPAAAARAAGPSAPGGATGGAAHRAHPPAYTERPEGTGYGQGVPEAGALAVPGGKVLALPAVRALAKEMGVDLGQVRGTGPSGRVLRQDVQEYAAAATYGRGMVEAPSIAVAEAPGGEPWMGGRLEQDDHGVIERVTLKGVRRSMARRMAESVARQAQVTTTEEADVSILRRIREKERSLAAERGIRLTYLAFVIKACASALKRFPRVNAVLAPECDELVLKRYYNVGLAVDTPHGLMVPNIKDVDRKSIFSIAEEVIDLVGRAQERKLDLSELHGGTFTVTNYGSIGGLYGTPVTNYPEVAILGMGRVRDVPVVHKGEIVVRQLLPLSLTYDHQLVDGAEAARFLNLIISYLEDPDLLLLESI